MALLHSAPQSVPPIHSTAPGGYTVALMGNPNVGKSTVFNFLTGMHQHTGNWPGKTVAVASGEYLYGDRQYTVIDLPGTYSLSANSPEEEIARDYLCFEHPDVTIVVADATSLLRNLNLLLQTLEITGNVVLCVNLMDEAKRKGITVDVKALEKRLGIPVVAASAAQGEGMKELMEAVGRACDEPASPDIAPVGYGPVLENALDTVKESLPFMGEREKRFAALQLLCAQEELALRFVRENGVEPSGQNLDSSLDHAWHILRLSGVRPERIEDLVVKKIGTRAQEIYEETVRTFCSRRSSRDLKLDRVLTSKRYGIPIMLLLLCAVFWLTITGANYPSAALSTLLFGLGDVMGGWLSAAGAPQWLYGFLIMGVWRTVAWVVSVMLPPMAIFFPLFTLLEDLGYLPRVAFNMDNAFYRCGACGKQALTMCMGFGCNAAGVIGCRIISSPRERLIAILTNNFVPCNGRFPTLIAIITMFFCGTLVAPLDSVLSALLLTGVILFGVAMTLLVSKLLSKTVLKGLPSSFTLELPPYRKPQVLKVVVRSIFDRTLFVLGRAVAVAIPAGALIWLMANVMVGDVSVLSLCAGFLDPFAQLLGMDGVILLAFILGLPANEIVVPIIIMSYMATGHMIEMENLSALRALLVDHGWTWVTACCVMLFSLVHFPCATTMLTIKKETGSLKWTALGFLIPTVLGMMICAAFNLIFG
ncbi:ferrous iron transport protein B [Provencibacterium massiliense]|uniref:ferrous iron transport protein B n=1 Tax=Provencibacterium massiliense TaxID=1841868 RepID=UPI0009A8337C|nr:ferrous iron transport protein B [Provencibacterium massiliense]RGB68697.1 ferrous iron transport protein B [Harryflintia acetispora]